MMVLAAAGTAAALGAWALAHLGRLRRRNPEETERLRRLELNRRGRIAGGNVVELIDATRESPARLIVYKYEVGGVSYEAAQDVSTLPEVFSLAQGLDGQTASVKYDPRQPTNSIIACEEWCGVRNTGPPGD